MSHAWSILTAASISLPRDTGTATNTVPANLPNLVSLCALRHLITVHRWGRAITLHADGTVTATSPRTATVLTGRGLTGHLPAGHHPTGLHSLTSHPPGRPGHDPPEHAA